MSIITARIDVQKISKEKLYEGAKGTYLDVLLIPTPNGQYGDYMVVQSITKEEREAGIKGAILGNAKNLATGAAQKPERTDFKQPSKEDDLPF